MKPAAAVTLCLAVACILLWGKPTQAQSIVLTNGWQLQSQANVSDSGNVISQANYQSGGWYAATVPGTVLTTLVNNGVYPEPLYGTNIDNISDSLCRTSCWYRTVFNLPASYADKQVWLNFAGINYTANVWINGSGVGSMQGAFTRGIFNITPYVNVGGTNALAVLITPEPNPGTRHIYTTTYVTPLGGDTEADGPSFFCTVGWDWLPTIPDRDSGIWQGVTVSESGPVVIQNPYVTSQLPLPATDSADLTIQATISNVTSTAQTGVLAGNIGGSISFQTNFSLLPYATQTLTFNRTNAPSLHILNPQLWWPNGYGAPNLYNLQLSASVGGMASDTKSVNFGIRQISYHLPGSTNLALVVNGVPVIAKGGCWGLDEGLKRNSVARLDAEIHMHRLANFMMIRNWCGQSSSEDFYTLCDKYGILVWSEFWQAGWNPINTNLFLANVRDTILRYRNHPCIAVWCGRNEAYPSPATIAAGDSNLVATLDPQCWYQAQSGSYQVGRDGGGGTKSGAQGAAYNWMPPENFYYVDGPFKTEIGSVSIPTLEAIEAMMPSNDWQTINNDWAEHNFTPGAMECDKYPSVIAARYGPFSNLADFVRKAQLANYEAFRAMYEGRFAKLFHPVTGVLTWMSNPAQPSFVWQLYSHDLEPNASLFAVQEACEPVHIMLNEKTGHLMVINNHPEALTGAKAHVAIYNLQGKIASESDVNVTAAPSAATDLGLLALPDNLSPVYFVKLELSDAAGKLVSDNFYWRAQPPHRDDLQALNTLPMVTLSIQATNQIVGSNCVISVTMSNPAPVVALMTHLQLLQATSGQRVLPVFYSDNYISLVPGESRSLTVTAATDNLGGSLPLLDVDGWNVTVNPSGSSGNVVGVVPNSGMAQATVLTPPPAPTLSVAGSGAHIGLAWFQCLGATSYHVKRSTTSGGETTLTNVSGISYTDSGLAADTTYYYQVSALNAAGESGNSSEVGVTTPR